MTIKVLSLVRRMLRVLTRAILYYYHDYYCF